jgi:hypothetical protein
MSSREELMAEVWRRMTLINGVQYTARNPKAEPGKDDFPAIQIIELVDAVQKVSRRGSFPIYQRLLKLAIELFIEGTSEGAATKELMAFINDFKTELYRGGPTLSGKAVDMVEFDSSQVLRPPVGTHSTGISMVFNITYLEDTGKLFP